MAKRQGDKFQDILDGAVKSFARSGYHKTRISDIAGEAGVADGTVYIYFRNKEDILISLFENIMRDFVSNLRYEIKHCADTKDRLAKIIEYHLTTLSNKPDQARVTQLELRQIDNAINQGISKPLKEYFDLIEEVIKEGQNTGHFRPDSDPKTARKVIFGAIDEAVTCWVMSGKPHDLNALSKPLYDLLLKGLQ